MRPAAAILAALEALPETTDDKIAAGPRPLILAPHPDDESLGCGGLIATACAAGRPPVVAILTNGAASHPGSQTHPPQQLAQLRKAEAHQAVAALGLPPRNLIFLDFDDAALPRAGVAFNAATETLVGIAQTQNCGVVIGPWHADPHCDHEAGAMLAAAVAKRARLPLCSYPVWGWLLPPDTEVNEPRRHGWRLDIGAQLPAKRQAIAAHRSQYGGLIVDSPDGFQLPAALLAVFERPFEVFIAP